MVTRSGRRCGDSPMDVADQVTVLPEHAAAVARPARPGGRSATGGTGPPRSGSGEAWLSGEAEGDQRLVVAAADPVAELTMIGWRSSCTHRACSGSGPSSRNDSTDPFSVGALRLALPVPSPGRRSCCDFTGRHTMERIPQRQPFTSGVHSRESRMGRPGLDSAYLLMAGTAGFGFRHGEVWGVHLGWSGNQNLYAERHLQRCPAARRSRAAGAGRGHAGAGRGVHDSRGSTPATAWAWMRWPRASIAFLRSRPEHPRTPRPVLVNTWEAVYFDHSLPKLRELADRAAEIGVERFVLDDGWFGRPARRHHAASATGRSSTDVWPEGLDPLIDHVTALGMQFGLWVEPEMVNLESDLARAHPEWLFSAGGRPGLPSQVPARPRPRSR